MKTIDGKFFDGLRPVPVPAKLDLSETQATLTAGALSVQYDNAALIVSPRIAGSERFITFPDGMQILCRDDDILESLPQESPSEGAVAWLENRTKVAAACVVTVIITLLCGYFFGLPVAARHIVNHLPMETEQAMGDQVLTWFDEEGWMALSDLNPDRQDELLAGFNRLRDGLPFQDFYQLEFRSGEIFGPNAFALPGGIIVVTDELVALTDSNDEILSVLAHEMGHVELRHVMRSILQNSIVGVAAAAVTADAATLSAAVAGLPMLLAQRRYSREFETEADDFAFELLNKHGISPAVFASMMEKLDAKSGKRPAGFGYFSTHPLSDERIKRAREADGAD